VKGVFIVEVDVVAVTRSNKSNALVRDWFLGWCNRCRLEWPEFRCKCSHLTLEKKKNLVEKNDKMPKSLTKTQINDAVRLATATVKNNPVMIKRKAFPTRILKSLSHGMILPLAKVVSAIGVSGPGLHSSVLRKLTMRELVSYVAKWSGHFALIQVIVSVYIVSIMFLLELIDSPVSAVKNDLIFGVVLAVVYSSVKRTFSQYKPRVVNKKNPKSVANENIRLLVKGRKEYSPSRLEKVVSLTFKASLLLGGAGGIALLYKQMICTILKDMKLPCTCSSLEDRISNYTRLLALDDKTFMIAIGKEGKRGVEGERANIKVLLKMFKHGLILLRCSGSIFSGGGGGTDRVAACNAMADLTDTKKENCMNMSCKDLGILYKRFAQKFHPDKGGDPVKMVELNRLNGELEKYCIKGGTSKSSYRSSKSKAKIMDMDMDDVD
jgi:hypothetical protein